MKQKKVEFTDNEVSAAITALNDFVVTAKMFRKKKIYWDALPEADQRKYKELTKHVESIKAKLIVLYQDVKREFH